MVGLARDFKRSWGNVIVIRHAFYEGGQLKYADSLYAHLDKILVAEGQPVTRGQQIGLVGNAHGLYHPHLHFEVHRNTTIGVVHMASTRSALELRRSDHLRDAASSTQGRSRKDGG